MSISSISFMGRRDKTEAPKRTRNKREKKTNRGVDVQILNDNEVSFTFSASPESSFNQTNLYPFYLNKIDQN